MQRDMLKSVFVAECVIVDSYFEEKRSFLLLIRILKCRMQPLSCGLCLPFVYHRSDGETSGLGMDALANGVLAWMLWQRDLSSSREEEEEEQE